MPKLNKTAIDNATPPAAGDRSIWCSEVLGFGVRIQSSGRKTYVVRYVTKTKIQRKMTLGRCSDFPVEKARDMARKIFAKVAEGLDPTADARLPPPEENLPQTMADLKEAFMTKHANPFKKASSAGLDECTWRLHILPHLQDRPVRSITEEDVLDVVATLKDKPAVANQAIAVLQKAFTLAEKWKWRDKHTNPCADVKKFRLQERELILSPAEIGRLLTASEALVKDMVITKSMANLVQLLLLTGCRLREIMSSQRSWVDEERCLLLLPDSKVGQRKIALSPAAMDVIAAMPKEQFWLVPGRVAGEHMVTPYRPWAKIKKKALLPKALRLHDLRHSFGSLAHMAGMTQKQIASALGHKQLSTTERYLHGRSGDSLDVAAAIGNLVSDAQRPPLKLVA